MSAGTPQEDVAVVLSALQDSNYRRREAEQALDRLEQRLARLEGAFAVLNELRSNIVSTQSASWSNSMYPLVAILDAAGMEVFVSSEEQMAQHLSCYGGAGGYPGALRADICPGA